MLEFLIAASSSTSSSGGVLDVLQSDLASVAHSDVHNVPPAICNFAVMLHVELNGSAFNAIQGDLHHRRVMKYWSVRCWTWQRLASASLSSIAPLLYACTLYLTNSKRAKGNSGSEGLALIQARPQRVDADSLGSESIGDVSIKGSRVVGALLEAKINVAASGREQVGVQVFDLLAPGQNHAQLAVVHGLGDGERALGGATVEDVNGLSVFKVIHAVDVTDADNVISSGNSELELAGCRRHHASDDLLIGKNVHSGSRDVRGIGSLAHNTLQSAVKLIQ
jgi:hypothetical protein